MNIITRLALWKKPSTAKQEPKPAMSRRSLFGMLAGLPIALRAGMKPVEVKPELPADVDDPKVSYGQSGIYFYGSSRIESFPRMTEADKKRYK